MQKKERKQRARKTPPLLPRLVILFFLLMVLLFMNIDMCSHILNYGSYEKTTATIVAKKTDGFLLLIPMAELSYQYEGTEYKEDKFFVFGCYVSVLDIFRNFIDFYIFIRTTVDFSNFLPIFVVDDGVGKHMKTVFVQV